MAELMRAQDEEQGNRKKESPRKISRDQSSGQQEGKDEPVFFAWIDGRQGVSLSQQDELLPGSIVLCVNSLAPSPE